jgi:hypothetical protein
VPEIFGTIYLLLFIACFWRNPWAGFIEEKVFRYFHKDHKKDVATSFMALSNAIRLGRVSKVVSNCTKNFV